MTDSKKLPASSILGRFTETVEDDVSRHTKLLPLGVVSGVWVEYAALSDDEADEIRKAAKNRGKLLARTRRDGSDDDPEGERQAYAQLLARACVQLMLATEEGYVPLHEAINEEEGSDYPPLRFDADLLKVFQAAGNLPDGLTTDSTAVDIVRYLHRRGPSTAPLLTMGALYDAWRAGVNQAVVAETVGE